MLWRKTIIVLCASAALIALLCTSESFENCIHERKNHQEYQALQEEVSLPVKTIIRSKLHLTCVRVTASNSENAGVIGALAGVVVAWFTFALWRSTDKLWLAAERQASDMKVSLAIAKEAADAARDSADAARHAVDADLSLNEPRIVVQSLELVPYSSLESGTATIPTLSFPVAVLRNYGSTPAIVSQTCLYCNVDTSAKMWGRNFRQRFPSRSVRRWPVGTIIMPGKDFVITNSSRLEALLRVDDERRRLIESPSGMGVYGYLLIVFSDLFGREITQEQLFLYCPIEMPNAGLRRGFVPDESRQSIKEPKDDREAT